jgi:curved DNA-binding protein CbpA
MDDFLKEYRLPTILSDLQRSLKTGALKYKHGKIEKRVFIEKGEMIFAASNLVEDRFGDVLLREGKITKENFDKSSELLRETGKRQGVILVEMGCLTPEETVSAVIHQVELIILSLFNMKDGEFEFTEGPLPSREVITLKLSTGKIIYRGIKEFLEQNELKGLSPELVPGMSDDPFNLFQDISLSEDDKIFLSHIDGKTPLKDIISTSGMDEKIIMNSTFALLSISVIEILDEARTDEGATAEDILEVNKFDSEHSEKIESLYQSLTDLDYYGLLEVSNDASASDIKKNFYRLAREFHPDRNLYLPVDMKDKLHEIFTSMNEAYKVLGDPGKREEYDRSPSKVSMETTSSPELAREKFSEGMVEFKKNNFTEATELFGSAAYIEESVPDYHYYHGLSLLGEDKLKEAEAAIRKAHLLDTGNDEILVELGNIYLKLGFNLRAKGNFEKALKLNPDNQKAQDGIALTE